VRIQVQWWSPSEAGAWCCVVILTRIPTLLLHMWGQLGLMVDSMSASSLLARTKLHFARLGQSSIPVTRLIVSLAALYPKMFVRPHFATCCLVFVLIVCPSFHVRARLILCCLAPSVDHVFFSMLLRTWVHLSFSVARVLDLDNRTVANLVGITHSQDAMA